MKCKRVVFTGKHDLASRLTVWTVGGAQVPGEAGIRATRVADGGDGLPGRNGASKTTTLRMLSTLVAPSGATARMMGFDVVRQTLDVRRRIAIVAQESAARPLRAPILAHRTASQRFTLQRGRGQSIGGRHHERIDLAEAG